ncbi:MAG: hypothetical protein WCJ19_00770 [bacterium]
MKLPKWAVTVTPVSKIIALILLITIPAAAFLIGFLLSGNKSSDANTTFNPSQTVSQTDKEYVFNDTYQFVLPGGWYLVKEIGNKTIYKLSKGNLNITITDSFGFSKTSLPSADAKSKIDLNATLLDKKIDNYSADVQGNAKFYYTTMDLDSKQEINGGVSIICFSTEDEIIKNKGDIEKIISSMKLVVKEYSELYDDENITFKGFGKYVAAKINNNIRADSLSCLGKITAYNVKMNEYSGQPAVSFYICDNIESSDISSWTTKFFKDGKNGIKSTDAIKNVTRFNMTGKKIQYAQDGYPNKNFAEVYFKGTKSLLITNIGMIEQEQQKANPELNSDFENILKNIDVKI